MERNIPNSDLIDAMGLYPMFFCRNWDGLGQDLKEQESNWIKIVLVTEPFAPLEIQQLNSLFDHAIPFKTHYLANFEKDLNLLNFTINFIILKIMPNALTMLDVACSIGQHLQYLQSLIKCEGLDINSNVLLCRSVAQFFLRSY